jgi:hypothetical protein
LNFRQFMEQGEGRVHNTFGQNTVGTHNDHATSSFLSSTWTGSEDLGRLGGLPSTDLEIPHVSRRSKIKSIEKNKNPIKVQLADGTTIYLSLDEFRRVDSRTKLEPNREITVTFQRRDEDGSPEPSKVVSIN